MSKETVECIFGNPDLTLKHVEILQTYFKVSWQFAKSDYIYYIDPSGITRCESASILHNKTNKYQFKIINVKTIKEYVNRLQKQETNLDRRDEQPTSRIQCTSSKASITSGHLEYGKKLISDEEVKLKLAKQTYPFNSEHIIECQLNLEACQEGLKRLKELETELFS